MNRKTILGALLLSALSLCAFGASSASALTLHECKEFAKGTETAQRYKDSKCSEKDAEGLWQTTPIVGRKRVTPTLTPTTAGNNVTEGEEAGTHAVLHATLGGVAFQITCTGITSPNSEAENVTEGSVMKITGDGKTEFTGCTMTKPVQCAVPATLTTNELHVTSSEDRLTFSPKEGTLFITFEVSNAAGKVCPAALKGAKKVEGKASGLVPTPTSIHFNSESGNEITFGGQAAQFTAVAHLETTGTGTLVAAETP